MVLGRVFFLHEVGEFRPDPGPEFEAVAAAGRCEEPVLAVATEEKVLIDGGSIEAAGEGELGAFRIESPYRLIGDSGNMVRGRLAATRLWVESRARFMHPDLERPGPGLGRESVKELR